MSCSQAEWLHGYFDGELDAVRAAEFEAHLRGCSACTQALAVQQGLRSAIRDGELYARAPASLRAMVRVEIAPPRAAKPTRPARRLSLAVAAALALVSFGVWRTVPVWREGVAERELAREVLDAHLRSLQLTRLTDVASTDQHTVKPWFVGKLDFAPAVVDLASDGFPLVGGRLDVVGGQSVAAVVYARRKHVVNVFSWPSDASDSALQSGAERGYNWIRWTRGGLRFWAVSDVAAPELEQLARRLSGS